LLLVLVSMLGCRFGAETAGEQGAAPLDIECQTFYRPSVEQEPGNGTAIRVGSRDDSGRADYTDMVFDVQLNKDPGEGASLVLTGTAGGSGSLILRELYQIDQAQGLQNQFVGGHGFTGLVYAYHPTLPAELQFFCSVQPQ
jgi:hypothetical protein